MIYAKNYQNNAVGEEYFDKLSTPHRRKIIG